MRRFRGPSQQNIYFVYCFVKNRAICCKNFNFEMITRKAEVAWGYLNGIISVYKPAEVSCNYVKNKLASVLCNELNEMETRPPKNYIEVNRTETQFSIDVRPSYADHVLCVGPRYQPGDINITFPSKLIDKASGVLVVGINKGRKISAALNKCYLTRCYHVTGVLGQATTDFYTDSKVIVRADYKHINKFLIDKVLNSYQGVNQRRIFEEYGIRISSQKAYDMAVSGLYRPKEKGATVVYGLKAVSLDPPNFTIEVQCTQETEDYLKNLIHNLGVSLKCFATCSTIRCIRQGCFHVDHTLLKKHWQLEHILQNMQLCSKILNEHFPDNITHKPTVTTSVSSAVS